MISRHTDTVLIAGILLLAPLVYWTGLKDYTLGPKLIVTQGILIIIVVRFAVSRTAVAQSPLLLPATVYGLVSAVSIFLATDPVASIVELTKLITGFTLFLVVSTRRPDEQETCVRALLVAVAVSAVLGICQHLNILPWSIPSAGLPSGTLGFRNIAAMVTIQAIPFAVYFLTRQASANDAWGAVLFLLFAFVIQTRTRGAWLGLLVSIVVGIVLARRYSNGPRRLPLKPLVIAMLLGVALGAVPPQTPKLGPQDIDEKKTTITDTFGSLVSEDGDRGRIDLWRRTIEMIVDRPLGVGLGNWALEYPAYDRGTHVTFSGAPARPHNDYLWIASETGLIGLAAFLWVLITALRAGVRRNQDIAVAAIASLVALLVHSWFSFPRDRATPTLVFWFVLGILGASVRGHRGADRFHWSVAAVLLLASTIVTSRLLTFEAHLYGALVPEQRRDWKEVQRHTGLALESGRFHSEALHLHGYALNAQGDYGAARAHYADNAKWRPHDVQFLNGYAIALQNTGNLDLAIDRYREARRLVAGSTDLDYNLATLLIQAQQPQEAISLLQSVARSEPKNAAVQFHLGNAHGLTGRDATAIEHLKKALELAPRFPQAWMVIGELYYRAGETTEAITAFQTFLALHKTDDNYSRRARTVLRSLGSKEANSQ